MDNSLTSKVGAIVGFGLSIFFICLFFLNFYSLVTHNYIIEPKDIFKVDTFKLLSRGYENRGGKNGSYFEFESSDRYEFRISGSQYYSVIDRNWLADTLMYSYTEFVAFADKNVIEKYNRSREPFKIELLQLEIGNRICIDLEKRNKHEHSGLVKFCIIMPLFAALCFFITRHDQKKQLRLQQGQTKVE